MIEYLANDWKIKLKSEFEKPYFQKLCSFLEEEYSTKTIYPKKELLFNAFNMTPFNEVKVVILGQDPYHEPNQAQGLAFYVPPTIPPPPSLKNIAKELATENNLREITIPDLSSWAKNGVFLLNTTLSVEAHRAFSHASRGWEMFTDEVIKLLSDQRDNLVFILWGSAAQRKRSLINISKHCILESAHPSPLSAYRGFFGSKPFSKANAYLTQNGKSAIKWLLPDFGVTPASNDCNHDLI